MIKSTSIYVKNFGCTSNKFDFEIMLAYLKEGGYKLANTIETADILLINTCGVKKATEDKLFAKLTFLQKNEKPIIITGCMPKINFSALTKIVPNYAAIIDPFSIDKINLAIKSIEKGRINNLFFEHAPKCKLRMPKIKSSKIIEIVQISEGCLGSCSFCCTKFARGRLFSYPPTTIVRRIKKRLAEGVKEFYITSQDTGAYGLDIKSNIPALLQKICKIEGDFRLRIGMMNPNHVLAILNQLVETYKKKQIFKFLHLPLQSGNNDVLKNMGRKYSVQDFLKIVNTFKKEMPKITIATDIICGFPNEDDNAFKDSIRIIKKIQADIVNVSKFFPRPRTKANKMKLIPNEIIKIRSRKMTKICKTISLKRNISWLNWSGDIIIDEIGKNKSVIGRNFAYKPIVIKDRKELGTTLNIQVKKAFRTYLEGKVIQ
ncbi:MAG: tRNA (N(6)-L-threonylcarbamoyladenosine(37)-C(2))-methylthiotransferase [Candidatus Bathyarchaeota archaeon]|nr:MAG: tRNA (N(6)-L-threonylcarbamoyladenosine(37)-C(2))-methylthiotransferase [Candidatus Bathyarchaeota archaeon]